MLDEIRFLVRAYVGAAIITGAIGALVALYLL